MLSTLRTSAGRPRRVRWRGDVGAGLIAVAEHFRLGVDREHGDGFGKFQNVVGFRQRARRFAAGVPGHDDAFADASFPSSRAARSKPGGRSGTARPR